MNIITIPISTLAISFSWLLKFEICEEVCDEVLPRFSERNKMFGGLICWYITQLKYANRTNGMMPRNNNTARLI